jgi:D-alanyl-lipoteichoic acid acyltransferase DltB (MBOAT superfamily)
MIFNSFVFWVFFGFVLLLYWRLPHRQQNWLLLISSYVFYGYWDWRFLGLLAASTVVDYFVGHGLVKMQDQRHRKLLIVVSVVVNLTFLGFFKYYGFFIGEFAELLRALGFTPHLPTISIVLPVGISFYTFQSMSYTIDVYRGATKPAPRLADFALFVSYFPQLVAGPIERTSQLLPQILSPRRYKQGDFAEGLYHILFGLLKKVVIADNLAPIVNRVFDTPFMELSGTEVLLGVYAFAIQIYCDFSGYSSIAQGVSKWMGIDLTYNFRMPYFSRTPSEFWQRWHISLSQWLRDYLYIPLGGNRKGPRRTYINLLLTMLLGGLWHGAAWTFIAWGAWQGLLLICYRLAGVEDGERPGKRAWVSVMQALLMFNLVCVGWLFFRATSWEQAAGMLVRLFTDFTWSDYAAYAAAMLAFFALPLMVYEWFLYRSKDMLLLLHRPVWQQTATLGYFIAMLILFPPLAQQVFIYFQF